MKLVAGRGPQTFKREVCVLLGREGRRVQERELSSLAYTAWGQKYKRKPFAQDSVAGIHCSCSWAPSGMLGYLPSQGDP